MDYRIKLGDSCPANIRKILEGATTADLFQRLGKEASNKSLPDLVITIEVAPPRPAPKPATKTNPAPYGMFAGKPITKETYDFTNQYLCSQKAQSTRQQNG
jgi:hypothetical protein